MTYRERTPRKQCPQCGWDADGRPRPSSEEAARAQGKRVPPPPKYDYECGNCGCQWTE